MRIAVLIPCYNEALSLLMFWPPIDEYVRTGFVQRVPTLVVSIAFGISSLLALVCGVMLDSIRVHSRQFHELAMTTLAQSGVDQVGRHERF